MAIKAAPTFSLADQVFNEQTVETLARSVAQAFPEFDKTRYTRGVLKQFPKLELKERIRCLVDALDDQFPDDFEKAIDILESALPEPLDPSLSDNDFGHFIWGVPSEWTAKHGCTEHRLDRSLAFLREATMRFTVESAIRPFLISFPDQTMKFIHECAGHENYHVRRLASEGIRPYLPWALRVRLPISEILEVLTRLHADSTRFVTRSCANTLNDLSRDDPSAVIKTLKQWRSKREQSPAELEWMTRHALRTLLKTDNKQALELVGYTSEPDFSLTKVSVPDVVRVGEALDWQGILKSKKKQKLKVALRIHYLKANGKYSIKVFAVKDIGMSKNEALEISKKLSFKPVTTRTLYPGIHHVELLVNGKSRGKRSFELITGS